jgi:hypothetical protein
MKCEIKKIPRDDNKNFHRVKESHRGTQPFDFFNHSIILNTIFVYISNQY